MAMYRQMLGPLSLPIFAIGFSAVIVQTLVMRELSVLFYGNELCLGVILGVWLMWTALGSGVLGRLVPRIIRRRRALAISQGTIALLLPMTLFGIRTSKIWTDQSIGEITGFAPMFVTSFATLCPFCLLSGFLFTLVSNIRAEDEDALYLSVGQVYALEGAGAGFGGVLASFFLVGRLRPFEVALVLGGVNLLSAGIALDVWTCRGWRGVLFWAAFCASMVLGTVSFSRLEDLSGRLLWRGYDLLHREDTIYGNLTLTRENTQVSFFENGLLAYTAGDLMSAEESAHFALLEHPDPRRVLLIGGGVGGALGQILLHPSVGRVEYVELDPRMIELGRAYLHDAETAVLRDPRVHLWHLDGRRFAKRTRNRYDVVLVSLPDPFTTQINRFYTVEFYREVLRILGPEGILSFRVTSSENYVGEELGDFLRSIYLSLSEVFEDIVVVPGSSAHFLACPREGILTEDPSVLIERLHERALGTKYVREYYLPYRMSRDRVQYLRERLEIGGDVRINRDLRPVGYYYDMILWSTYFSPTLRKLFVSVSGVDARWPIVAMVLVLILLLARKKSRPRRSVMVTVVAVGFSELALEVIILLGFQIVYGYVYHHLALIVACYMIGLAAGGWRSTARLDVLREPLASLERLQLAMFLYPFVFLLFLYGCVRSPPPGPVGGAGFSGFAFGAGLIGGLQFPVANRLYLQGSARRGGTAGILYAADLGGSCLGAFTASTVFLPILGIPWTCTMLGVVNLAACGGLMIARRSKAP